MHRGVDPAPTLGQENLPVVRCNSVRMSVPDELSLVHWEVLEQQRRQVTIFTEVEKVLHMQCVDTVLLVVLDDLVADEEWLVGVRGAQTVKRETTRQTSDGTEQRLERLSHMVGDEVLVDLDCCHPRLPLVRNSCLPAYTHDHLIVMHTIDQSPE